jgi:hypothetical protein
MMTWPRSGRPSNSNVPMMRSVLGDFVVCAEESIGVSSAFVGEFKGAAVDGVELLNAHLQIARADPLDVLFGIGVCPEHEFARSVEFAGDEEFLFVGFCGYYCVVYHFYFSFY